MSIFEFRFFFQDLETERRRLPPAPPTFTTVFSGWPLKQKGMDLYIIAMCCCHSWCWWAFFSHTKWSTCPKSENLVAFLRFEVPMCDSLCGPVVKLAAFWWPPHESKTTKNIPNFNLVTFRKYEHRIFTSLSKDKFFVLQWNLVASGFK